MFSIIYDTLLRTSPILAYNVCKKQSFQFSSVSVFNHRKRHRREVASRRDKAHRFQRQTVPSTLDHGGQFALQKSLQETGSGCHLWRNGGRR